ncbi:MAG: response regulator [Paenibacillaceae bacterium]|nr:response regulator [Paenibacillaceae bacterium]
MYKLMIVDDNPLDRRGVARLCEWESLGVQVAGSCASAMEALDEIDRLQPDIVLTDVQMPVMDGIEFGSVLRERCPQIKLVFMSSHDDFAYARSALMLEAGDYVLKPIRKHELQAAVAKVADKLTAEREQSRERDSFLAMLRRSLPLHQEQFLRELLFGTSGAEAADAAAIRGRMSLLELEMPADGRYRVLLLRLTDAGAGQRDIPGYLRLMHHLERQMAGQERRRGQFIRMVPVTERQLAFIVGLPGRTAGARNGEPEELQALDWILQAEEDTDKRVPLQLSIGVSRAGGFAELSKLYAQAVRAGEAKVYSDRQPRILFAEEIDDDETRGDEGLTDAELLRQEVREAVFAEADPDSMQLLGRLGMAGDRLNDREVKAFMLLLSNALQQLYIEAGKPLNGFIAQSIKIWGRIDESATVSDFRESFNRMIALTRDELLGEQMPYYDKVVQQIRAIIARRYAEQVTIQEIADEVFLSLSHANNIFKSKTGQKIFDFLTEFRMDQAKRLLRDRDSRIYQVAQRVGYANKSHFCLIFKKNTGLSPSEYKSQYE